MDMLKLMVRNRRVALVCPAKELENEKRGDRIDSSEVVVRCNKVISSQYAGTRTDILYSSLEERVVPGECNYQWDIDDLLFHGVQLVSSSYPVVRDIMHVNTCKFVYLCQGRIAFRSVRNIHFNALEEMCGCVPFTGMVAMYEILKQKPKSLTVYGMTWQKSGYVPAHREGEPECDNGWHKVDAMIAAARKLALSYDGVLSFEKESEPYLCL